MRSDGFSGALVIGFVSLCCLLYSQCVRYIAGNLKTNFNQGIILTRSNTRPLPSELRAHTGWEKGWKESAQQSNGVFDPGWGASAFLEWCQIDATSHAQTKLTP